jgi:hypothetical protein
LIAAAALAAAGIASATVLPTFEELRWTAPGTEYQVLSTQPRVCLDHAPALEPEVVAGQALFNTPTLLGGQAAKARLSCASCHVNGRDNPHFMLSGISRMPGSADVTNSFFNAARGNAAFDPVSIPDLAMPGKVSRDPTDRQLEAFIRTLIVEEFAGAEPSPAVLNSLASYVRAVKTCPDNSITHVARRLDDQLVIMNGALTAAVKSANEGNDQEFALLIAAARHQLGLIAERYAATQLQRERLLLLQASRDLVRLSEQQRTAGNFQQAIIAWQSRFDKIRTENLVPKENLSLYDEARLRAFVPMQRESR